VGYRVGAGGDSPQGECGGALLPLRLRMLRASHSRHMRALDRLKAAVAMKATRRCISLPNGEEFEFWSKPVTLAQRARAQKLAGNDSPADFALQLLVMLAQDENGQKLFGPGDVAELRNELPASVVENLMLQLLQDAEASDEDEALDPKPSSSSSKRTTS